MKMTTCIVRFAAVSSCSAAVAAAGCEAPRRQPAGPPSEHSRDFITPRPGQARSSTSSRSRVAKETDAAPSVHAHRPRRRSTRTTRSAWPRPSTGARPRSWSSWATR